MNNAVASKDQLGLSVGVSLSSQQVAALTHDIVWLEEHEVNGEKVLVPVLYLAQANNRLGPTGALLAGNDVTVIAGENLENVGTIRATNNLSVTAGNDVVNSGLLEAGNRLDLLAGNDVVNKSGGIIAGRDVSVMAVGGDVINERSVTSAKYIGRYAVGGTDYADSAARIEAANDMRISAGRDVSVIGGVLQSGRDTAIDAGRDVNLRSASTVVSDSHNTTVTQLGADVASGRDLKINAARDVNVIASQISAKRDIAASAGEDLTISSAADEYHYFSQSKKVTVQKDNIRQVATDMEAGGSISLVAGQDLAVTSSRITAANEAYLVAGDNLDILAAQDSDYSLYDKKKKGSWGKKQTKRDEVTDIRHVGSEIKTGGDLLLVSGGDQRYQAAKLDSGNDLTIQSGGAVVFEGVKDLHQESHEKSKSDLAWTSAKGKGQTDETLRQSELMAQGQLAIRAAGKVTVDIKEINQKTVSQVIAAMAEAEPGLQWLKQANAQGNIDWRVVKELHQSWDYKHSGLGAAPALIITIVASYFLGPLMGAVASNFSIGTINGGGDIGAGLKATVSADAIKGYATQYVTAGLLSGLDEAVSGWNVDGALIVKPDGVMNPGYSSSMLDWSTVSDNLLRSTSHALVAGSVNTVINGGSLKDNLGAALITEGVELGAAFGNKQVGDLADYLEVDPGTAQKMLMHAVMSGAISAVSGGDFKTGAVAGAAAEGLSGRLTGAFGKYVDARMAADPQFKVATAQVIGVLAGAFADGDPAKASWIAGNVARYNDLLHSQGPDGGQFTDPTNLFDDNGLPRHQPNDLSPLDKAKVQISEMLLSVLLPKLPGLSSLLEEGGLFAGLNAVFSKSAAGLDVAGGGAATVEAGAGETLIGGASGAEVEGAAEAGQSVVNAEAGGVGNPPLDGGESKAILEAAGPEGTVSALEGVPGRVQSRVNLANDGMEHLASRHLSGKPNASQFSIGETELRILLQSKSVVNTPVTRVVDSADGMRYVREVSVGRSIGVDKFSGGQSTSVMTVMTDKFGNLVTAFPGVLK